MINVGISFEPGAISIGPTFRPSRDSAVPSAIASRIAGNAQMMSSAGLMLVLTVLSINVFGDGVRDAFDPRAKVRVEH